MCLEETVPFFHSVDLVAVDSLTRALWKVSLSPLGETSCDLFDTDTWIFTVVSVEFGITSLSVVGWSTMWELVFIVESTSLVTSWKVSFHTISICLEFCDPCLLRWEEGEPVVHNFLGEINQFGQSLEWVTWWDLLFILSRGKGNKDSWWEFHLVSFFDSYRVFDATMRKLLQFIVLEIALGSSVARSSVSSPNRFDDLSRHHTRCFGSQMVNLDIT